MPDKKIAIMPLPLKLAICRLNNTEDIPSWALACTDFFSITKTLDELSIICSQDAVPANVKREIGWRAFKVVGPLDFSLTGVLSSLISPLAQNKISIFALSTFDTDYVLIKEENFARALEILSENFVISG